MNPASATSPLTCSWVDIEIAARKGMTALAMSFQWSPSSWLGRVGQKIFSSFRAPLPKPRKHSFQQLFDFRPFSEPRPATAEELANAIIIERESVWTKLGRAGR